MYEILVMSVDCSVDRQQSLLDRPVDRICTGLCTFQVVHLSRPIVRPHILQCSLFVNLGRLTELQSSLFELGRPCGRPEIPTALFLDVGGQPATVQNPGFCL